MGGGWEVFTVFRRKGSGNTSWLSSLTLWEGTEKMELVILEICAHRYRGNKHKLENGRFSKRDKLFYRETDQMLEDITQRNCGVSRHRDIKSATGHVPEQLSLTGLPLSRGQTENSQWSLPANKVLLPVSITCSDKVLSCF